MRILASIVATIDNSNCDSVGLTEQRIINPPAEVKNQGAKEREHQAPSTKDTPTGFHGNLQAGSQRVSCERKTKEQKDFSCSLFESDCMKGSTYATCKRSHKMMHKTKDWTYF